MRTFVLTMATLLAIPAFAQEDERYEERLDVDIVLVDATVTNRRGEQILGLDKEDFTITEDGIAQEIDSVEYFTNRRLLDQPESQAPFKVARTDEPRYFVLFFDKAQVEGISLRNTLWRASREAKKFVRKELAEGDLVAVAAHGPRLEMFSDFTSDRAQLDKALDAAVRFGHGIDLESENDAGLISALDPERVMSRTGRIYDALGTLGEALQTIRGRKVLVLFTPGFGEGTGFGTMARSDEQWYEPMVRALNEANTSVYGINLLENISYSPLEQQITRLASETGGEYFRSPVSFLTPLREIENENNGYYLITYRSSKPKGEHGYQKVDVALRNPEFEVKARDGYIY